MKFSFINPGPSLNWTHVVSAPASWPPLGILYIATVLKENNFEVSILDVTNEVTFPNILKWVEREDPDFLGFSTLSSSGRAAANIAKEVKEINPNILIAFGNYHATFNAMRLLEKYPFIDVIVRNEAEITCLELANSLERGKKFEDIRGIVYREGDRIISTPEREVFKNLDELPFPDRNLLKNEYVSKLAGLELSSKKFTTVISSRGCPYMCKYCACSLFSKRTWRPRSPENILEELQICNEKFDQILFVDDNFLLDNKRIIKLCSLLKKNRIEFDWICDARVDRVTRDVLETIARTGCKIIYYGMESANQRILDYYSKNISPSQSIAAAKATRKAGIEIIVGSFILGAPTETVEEICNTLKFAESIEIDVPLFHPLEIQPGTPLWIDYSSSGFLDEEKYWETGVYASDVCPNTVTLDVLYPLMINAFKKFLLRPKFIGVNMLRLITSRFKRGILFRNFSNIVNKKIKLSEIIEVPQPYRDQNSKK